MNGWQGSGCMQEHRQETRFDYEGAECLDIYQHGHEFELLVGREHCCIHNVSKHGLMISSSKRLEKHSHFRLRFHFEAGTELTLFGQVRWVVSFDNRYLAGLWLEDTLGTDYLLWQNRLSRMLLNQLRPPSAEIVINPPESKAPDAAEQ